MSHPSPTWLQPGPGARRVPSHNLSYPDRPASLAGTRRARLERPGQTVPDDQPGAGRS